MRIGLELSRLEHGLIRLQVGDIVFKRGKEEVASGASGQHIGDPIVVMGQQTADGQDAVIVDRGINPLVEHDEQQLGKARVEIGFVYPLKSLQLDQ